MNPTATFRAGLTPAQVHGVIARYMLKDGYDLVLDLEKSHGRRLYDSQHQRTYLDLFSCFATVPVGTHALAPGGH